jgi:hypothetical protein
MTHYEQPIEVGKGFIREGLARIASELNEPRLLEMELVMTDRDFPTHFSLIDRKRFRVVMKVKQDDLADSGADETVRRKITCHLEAAVKPCLAA